MPTGPCHLCGAVGPLSFEHVPPEAAFNDRKVVTPDARKAFELKNLDDLERLTGPQSQRGQGGHTLCIPCNNNTGHWYGPNYVAWVYQGAAFLSKLGGTSYLALPYHLLPLRVIKQLVCMFFSVNSSAFREDHPYLEQFVLNREMKYLPPKYKIYVGYLKATRSRAAGVTGSMTLNDDAAVQATRIYSEISFPPFAYILSIDSPQPEHQMLDISFFASYGYTEFATLNLPLPTLSIYTPFPGDFRSREQVLSESKKHDSTEGK